MAERPTVDKHTTTLETAQFKLAACGMQGWRKTMEDAHVLEYEVLGDRNNFLVGVFDGHASSKASQWCADKLTSTLLAAPSFAQRKYKEALLEAFLSMEAEMRAHISDDDGGCTANVVLAMDGIAYCANVGDSRAVLYRGDVAIPLSTDHKPLEAKENQRIIAAGGSVTNGRLAGQLTLSRALGDYGLKERNKDPYQQALCPVPDITMTELGPLTPDWLLVLGCDGIWETTSNEIIGQRLRAGLAEHKGDLGQAAEYLVDSCLSDVNNGLGTDNMTVVLVQPNGFQ